MQHPAVGTIHITRRLLTLLVTLANQFEQGLIQLRQIRDFRRPVIHLQVDVRGVFRIPRRKHLVVPEALQIGRVYIIRLTATNQQVSPKLEIGGDEVIIGVRIADHTKALNTLVHGHAGVAVWAQIELHTVVVVFVHLSMQGLQRVVT